MGNNNKLKTMETSEEDKKKKKKKKVKIVVNEKGILGSVAKRNKKMQDIMDAMK